MTRENPNNKVYVYSGGCTSNLLDGQRMLDYFRKNDYELVSDPTGAGWLIVNTCAFDAHSEDKSIQIINELKNLNPEAKVVVTGCLPAINRERMSRIHKGEYFIPKGDEDWGKLDEIFNPGKIPVRETEDPSEVEKSEYTKRWAIIERYPTFKGYKGSKLEALTGYDENAEIIRVAKGCLGNCSYCAIKKARGSLKSERAEKLLDRFEEGIRKGKRSFKLWAEDIGDYGKDINTNLAELLEKILDFEGDYKLEILASNPKSFIELYDKLLPSLKDKRLESFTISVQSGSEKILERMNRGINLEALVKTLNDLRKKAPHLTIRSHYMVGFPGESWKDFFQTISLMCRTKMYKSLIFKFDPKPNTPAEKMDRQVSGLAKYARMKILMAVRKLGSIKHYDGEVY